MLPYRQKLQALLRELFQFDSADLDFGIYAIMNRKRDEVTRFIEHDLLDAIHDGLQLISEAQREGTEAVYQAARQALEQEVAGEFLVFDVQGNLTEETRAARGITMRRLREAYEEAKQERDAARLSADLEAQVYNDLYRFFARYYDDGDFIAQRRYGAADKYAIPYNGEEVTLYWANFDQYYVKSGETFTDYRFQLEGGVGFEPATVFLRLQTASVAQNNVKGEKRFFVLAGNAPLAWDAGSRTLTVAFEYRPLTEEEKKRAGTQKQQDKLSAEAEKAILDAASEPLVKARLGTPDGEKEQTTLARHLARYTARNTRDYFIHKDLAGFLTRELDFYLKSEVLRLEDLDWNRPGVVRIAAARLETVRHIASKIIAFLVQIEDFQKRLWEKRKFVVQSDWCVTLDRVPEALYGEIAANARQRAEWARLYGVEVGPEADTSTGSVQALSQHPFMMVDTAFFDADIKARLLASFEDLDATCDGLLVHGENFQALRLLMPRYREQVKCIYIDPPYNTGDDGFVYKDNFQHSSWLAMMGERLKLGHDLLKLDGVFFSSIDYNEIASLKLLLETHYQDGGFEGLISWRRRHNQPNDKTKMIGLVSEYLLAYAKDPTALRAAGVGKLDLTGDFSNPDNDPRGNWASKPWKVGTDQSGTQYTIVSPTGKVFDEEWMGDEETYKVLLADSRIIFPKQGDGFPRKKYFKSEREEEGQCATNWWEHSYFGHNSGANDTLSALFGAKNLFSNPKPVELLRGVIQVAGRKVDLVCDYFAGSGTIAHAVINLNREDGEHRKYILVEMADYFDTILKPRLEKVAYASDWKDGKPVPGSPGQSHMFHYIRLESYEDALNNVRFRDLDAPLLAALHAMPDYMLHYMLDYETASSPSLLDLKQFERPFEYKLNITRHDVTEPCPADLVTTFNFLLGLRVHTLRRFQREGRPVVRVTGTSPDGRRVCVLWRDVPPLEEMEAEKDWLQAHVLPDVAYDLLYVNGESALPGALPSEPEFKRLMFEGVG